MDTFIHQDRSIREKLILFWVNHFGNESDDIGYGNWSYNQHNLIRQFALGNFKQMVDMGKHVFFVDVEPNQESVLERVIEHHPRLTTAGTGTAAPHWTVAWLHRWHQFKRTI